MIKNILSEQFKDLISEDTLNTIEEAFTQAVEEKSKEKIQLESENLKTKLDEEYTAKLEQLTEKIDTDLHSEKDPQEFPSTQKCLNKSLKNTKAKWLKKQRTFKSVSLKKFQTTSTSILTRTFQKNKFQKQ